MFVRVCRSLQDIGVMVPVGDVVKHVTPDEPYFRSLYDYTQEGKDYFDTNGRIKGFKGEVSTSSLIFDIDGIDLEESRINTIRLIDHLKTRGLYEELASIISFSGSKGYHIMVNTDHRFAPNELKKLCVTLGKEIEFVGECKLDPSVYNTNRIFRIVNTLNEKSGLYKVDLTESDLRERTTEEIMEYAKTPKQSFTFESKIPKIVIDNALESIKVTKRTSKQPKFHITPRISRNIEEYGCYLAIQNGEVGHGESNAAFLRLAQFYKDSGATRQQTREKLVLAAHNRTLKHPSTNEISDEKLDYEILGCIYSGEGYTFTHTDEFLTEKCRGTCLLHGTKVRKPVDFKEKEVEKKPLCGFGFNARMNQLKEKPVDLTKRGFKSLKQSAESFDKFCDEMDTTRVYTGIPELDDKVMIVPSGIVVINARPSVGKCLGPEVPVMKFNGDITRADQIKKGDLLMGPDSKPRTVLGIGKGKEEMFRITPVKGEPWTCNKSHILSLRCNSNISKKYRRGQIYNMSVEEYLNSPERVRHHLKIWRTAVDFDEKDVPFHPYLIGIWLAEGSVGHSVLHTGDAETIDEILKIGACTPNMEVRVFPKHHGCNKISIKSKTHKNNFLDYIKNECYVNGQKRIPREYLVNSRSVRLQLLAGLLDGDGYAHNNTYEITSKYPELAKDIAFLSQTLGFLYTNREKKVQLEGWDSPRVYQRMFISGKTEQIPMRVVRKRTTVRNSNRDHLNIGFKIESIGVGDYYGVELDGDHLYLLGDTTVTHNTSIMLNMMDNICRSNKSGISALVYSADMSEDEFYAKMMTRVLKISTSEAYAIRKDPHYHELRKKADLEIEKAYGSAMICYQKRLTVDQVREDLTALRGEGRLPKAVFIDYVQKLIGCEDYNTGVQNLMELKAIQDEFKTNLILLSQIPRQGGSEETPVRTSGAAKGGSIYEETASIVLNMWRPMRHAPDTSADNVLTIYIAKNRMGAGDGDINLHFNGAHSEIRSMTPEEYEEFKINMAAYEELKHEQSNHKRAKFR